jgi:hypothetical protein
VRRLDTPIKEVSMLSRLTGGLALAATLAVAIVVVGCGGGEDHLTKAEFIRQADAVCKKGNDQINKVANQTFDKKQPSQADLNKFATDTLIPTVQTELDGVRDLNPPSEDEDQVNALLDEAQAALDKGKQDPAALTSSNADPFKKANQLTKDYGLKECGAG